MCPKPVALQRHAVPDAFLCKYLSDNTRLLNVEHYNGMEKRADGSDVRRDRPDGVKKALKETEEKKRAIRWCKAS